MGKYPKLPTSDPNAERARRVRNLQNCGKFRVFKKFAKLKFALRTCVLCCWRSHSNSTTMSSSRRRLYVGKLSYRTRERDLEDLFSKYGKIINCDLKHGYAFVEFDDDRDADDAVRGMDGVEVDGANIVVEASHGGRRSGGGGRGGGDETCYSCGGRGHWYVNPHLKLLLLFTYAFVGLATVLI